MFVVSNRKVNYELGGIVWAGVGYCLGTCLEGLKKAAESFRQDGWLLCQELNPRPPTREADTLAIQ